jgi:hypothetical protein
MSDARVHVELSLYGLCRFFIRITSDKVSDIIGADGLLLASIINTDKSQLRAAGLQYFVIVMKNVDNRHYKFFANTIC